MATDETKEEKNETEVIAGLGDVLINCFRGGSGGGSACALAPDLGERAHLGGGGVSPSGETKH